MKPMRTCGLLLVVFALAGPAGAAIVQFELSGVVEVVADSYGDLDGIVKVGDPYTVRYVFDTDVPDQLPGDPDEALYGGLSAQLILPTWQMEAPAPLLHVTHLSVNDSMSFIAVGSQAEFQAHLGSGGGILASDSFPWPMPGFSQGHVQVYWSPDGSTKFWGAITAFPEPSSVVLALLGIGAVCARRRIRF